CEPGGLRRDRPFRRARLLRLMFAMRDLGSLVVDLGFQGVCAQGWHVPFGQETADRAPVLCWRAHGGNLCRMAPGRIRESRMFPCAGVRMHAVGRRTAASGTIRFATA